MISSEKVNIQRRILHGSSTVHVAEARFMHDGDAYGCLIWMLDKRFKLKQALDPAAAACAAVG